VLVFCPEGGQDPYIGRPVIGRPACHPAALPELKTWRCRGGRLPKPLEAFGRADLVHASIPARPSGWAGTPGFAKVGRQILWWPAITTPIDCPSNHSMHYAVGLP